MVDAGGVGDVIETFPVASDTITCIAAVPEFDEHDPEVLASKCTYLPMYVCTHTVACTHAVVPSVCIRSNIIGSPDTGMCTYIAPKHVTV